MSIGMEQLPEELLAKIFSYLDGFASIAASQVCSLFKLVAVTQIRSIDLKICNENQIGTIANSLKEFFAIRKLKLEISYDIQNIEKSQFCNQFSDKLSNLTLREMTFLNPFFDNTDISFSNLTTLSIENSDLSSSSSELSEFILRCPQLKKLTISGCSGLEIEALDYLGQRIGTYTQLEEFNLFPTYCYFDVSHSSSNYYWTIDKLTTLSVRSKLVVMKPNFVRNLIGNRSDNLKSLELVGDLDAGEHLVTRIINNFPNLEKLSLGKGCSTLTNDDFTTLCNYYSKMTTLEFHFSPSDLRLDLRSLRKNSSITELMLGLTKDITIDNLMTISKNLPNICRLSIVLYYLSTSNQEFLTIVTKVFPKVQHLEFQRTGMAENMKFTSINDEMDSPHLQFRHFDDIKNLANWIFMSFSH